MVFDTNTLVSAVLFSESTPRRAVRWVVENGEFLSSPETIEELSEVLSRQKFNDYVDHKYRLEYLEWVKGVSRSTPTTTSIQASQDADDNKFLELAVSGNADVIVTGDSDLIDLHPFRDIDIITPRNFADQYAKNC